MLNPLEDWYSNEVNLVELRNAISTPIVQRAMNTLERAAAPRTSDDPDQRIRREGYFEALRDFVKLTVPRAALEVTLNPSWVHRKVAVLSAKQESPKQ